MIDFLEEHWRAVGIALIIFLISCIFTLASILIGQMEPVVDILITNGSPHFISFVTFSSSMTNILTTMGWLIAFCWMAAVYLNELAIWNYGKANEEKFYLGPGDDNEHFDKHGEKYHPKKEKNQEMTIMADGLLEFKRILLAVVYVGIILFAIGTIFSLDSLTMFYLGHISFSFVSLFVMMAFSIFKLYPKIAPSHRTDGEG